MLDFFEIGEIVNVHGVRGAVKVIPLTDDALRFKKLKTVILSHHGTEKNCKVTNVQFQPKFVIVKLEGIDDRDRADMLRGAKLMVPRSDAISLAKDTYFVGDLIGCTCVTEEGEVLGKVDDVYKTGCNDVYDIIGEDGSEIMLPAIHDVIKNVDIEKAVITVHLLPGLREVYNGTSADENTIR